MKKVLLLGMMCLIVFTIQAQSYVDLGLPSKTKWKSQNEKGYYTYDEAVSNFNDFLPTEAQFVELLTECKWTWTGRGYKVKGPNGKSIFLPAVGYSWYNGEDRVLVGSHGYYWSSKPYGSDGACFLFFGSDGVNMGADGRHRVQSVRLVQD